MYGKNVYYNPDALGLDQVDVLDQDGMSYEYNTLAVWKHLESGRVFYAQDSGCSCPTPFEDFFFHGPDDTNLHELTAQTKNIFETFVDSWNAGYGSNTLVPRDKRDAFVDAAIKALPKRRKKKVEVSNVGSVERIHSDSSDVPLVRTPDNAVEVDSKSSAEIAESRFQKAANDLLRSLNREIFNDSINIDQLPNAVDLVCKLAEQVERDTRECIAKLCDERVTYWKARLGSQTAVERISFERLIGEFTELAERIRGVNR